MKRKAWLPFLLALAAVPVFGDDDDWRRRDRGPWGWERGRDRGGVWGPAGRTAGYGRYEVSVVDQTMSDLRRVASRNRYDSHERNHFERALYHLDRFRYNYLREGRFDKGRLDDAIEHIDDLTDARQLHPRDRELLARDLRALRDLRSRRGGYGW